MSDISQKTLGRYFKAPASEIVYLKAVLESYEGMALVRTVNRGRPDTWIEVLIAQNFASTIDKVLEELSKEIDFKEVSLEDLPNPHHPELTKL